jgi:enamine deaminase RidA (YjgF/YER057c/UK114 family)
MPDPKPARAAVQVTGLIGGAKVEISAIAVGRPLDSPGLGRSRQFD